MVRFRHAMHPARTASRLLFGTLGLAGVVAVGSSVQAASGLASIRLTSERDILLADGKSSTTLTAEVRDERGAVVPDGTPVRFATTGGLLDTPVAATRNGVARVTLTAADLPGTALVTVNLESGAAAPAQRVISFSTDADTALAGSAWARVEATGYVGYAADNGVIQAMGKNGSARVTYRGLEVSADTLQLNVHDNTVLALGGVGLARGRERRAYSSLRYNLVTGEGVGERLEDGRLLTLLLQGMEETAPSETTPQGETFTLTDISEARLTVKARSIALEPSARLQFRRAEFYLEGSKILALPFHVMVLGQETLWAEQVVGYGPHGMTVDFPLHFDVRPSAVGTLHVRRSPRVGASAYSTRPGWTLDLERTYNRGGAADGALEITGVTRQDWGARWTHAQRLDGQTRAQFYADFPNHSGLFANTFLSRSFRGFSVNATATGSRITAGGGAGGDWRGQLYAETDARPLPAVPLVRYALNLSTARHGFYGPNAPPAYQMQTAGLRLFTPPLALGPRTRLTQSLSLGQAWTSGAGNRIRDGASLRGTVSLAQQLGRLGSATLSYDHAQTPESGIYRSSGLHRLGMNLSLRGGPSRNRFGQWNLLLTGSHSLDRPFSTLYGTMGFSLGGPWSGRITLNSARLSTYRYQDIEYALIRRVGGRDIALYYSTTARRLQLDLTGARF